MSAFGFSTVSAARARATYGQGKRRWIHGSLMRQTIMMPAMSPLMTEGTITRWKKKEGEAFAAGDVLLQIESDIAMIDVEAHTPGILGKILMPDGTSGIPVEQVIALVARDMDELALLQTPGNVPAPPPFNPIPVPPSVSLPSSRRYSTSSPRTPSVSLRTPSLFEMHTMGYGHRSAHVGGFQDAPLTPRLDTVAQGASAPHRVGVPPYPSPRIPLRQQQELRMSQTPLTAKCPASAVDKNEESVQIDGAAIRRMIVSNLSSKQENQNLEFDDLL